MLRIVASTFLLAATTVFAADTSTAVAVNAINTLGIELLHRVAKPDQNALLSPYSIQSALAMTYAGADGVTREEMAKALHYPKDEAEVHRSFAALQHELDDAVRKSGHYIGFSTVPDPTTLTTANRLFGQSGYDFREPFLTLLKDNYAAPFESLDFRNDAAVATKQINAWVRAQTHRRIENLIPDGKLDSLTRLVLVNGLYFKAPWAEPFERTETKPGRFDLKGGQSVDVTMMFQRKEHLVRRGFGYTALQKPYRGGEFQFLVLLPDDVDGLAALEAKLSGLLLVLAGQSGWEQYDVSLYLPRFSVEPAPLRLSEALEAMGMKSAFNKPLGSANFDRVAPRRLEDYLALSEVFHKAFLYLDEKGTEAVAASGSDFCYAGTGPEPIEVRVDHPFLFAIQHRASGACLFLGRVVDPR